MPVIEKNIPAFEITNVSTWQTDNLGEGTTIVVLDEGFSAYPHMAHQVEVMAFDYPGEHDPLVGHGTGVMSIGYEIAPKAKIVFMPFNSVRSEQKWDMLEWIINHSEEIDVITMSISWASVVASKYFDTIKWLGIPFTVASGNDGEDDGVDSPADFDYTLAIGAAGVGFSGRTHYSNGGPELTCIAPLILSPNATQSEFSRAGTSFSTPFVAFSLLLYASWRKRNGLPKLTQDDALELIKANAKDIINERFPKEYPAGFDYSSGWGLFKLPNEIPIIEKEEPEIIMPIEEPEEGDNKMKIVAISDGHGMETAGKRTPLLPNGMIMLENEFNSAVKRYLDAELKRCGFNTLLVAEGSFDVALTTRTNLANNAGADIYVSIHANAFDGVFNDSDPKGIETFYYPGSVEGKRLAESIHKYLIQGTNQTNRGIKTANFHEIRETNMPAVLIEAGFMDNLEEAMLLLDDGFRKEVAKEIAMGVCDYFGVVYVPLNDGMQIISAPSATISQMKAWAKGKNANQLLIDLAETFYNVSVASGINPIITYCQSAKETGYMKFGGVLDASFKNPCGLKTTSGGNDTSPSAHTRFDSWEQGITAQVDHLALYAGANGYPKANTLDPRHFPYLLGKAPTVESLGGKWAPSTDYGESITRMVKEVEAIIIEEPIEEPISDLVDISISLHGKPVVIKGIFKDGVNYIPIRFVESMGYKVDGIGSNVNIEYRE